MAPKQEIVTNIRLTGKDYEMSYTGTEVVFPGYSKVYQAEEEMKKTEIAPYQEGEMVHFDEMTPLQHFTKGPLRYNEARVVKAMEELGIGRPSTYASTIATLSVEPVCQTSYPFRIFLKIITYRIFVYLFTYRKR